MTDEQKIELLLKTCWQLIEMISEIHRVRGDGRPGPEMICMMQTLKATANAAAFLNKYFPQGASN